MKGIYTILIFLFFFFFSFSQSKKEIDIKKSNIEWVGKKVTGKHEGTIKVKSGYIELSNNKIIGGEFIVNMTSIICTDLSGGSKKSLEGHLKDEDFFDVENHPTSSLQIKSSDKNKIYGTITIKGISQPIEFDYKMESRGGQVIVFSDIKIDRTKFNIHYKSKTIFPTQFLDNFIYDEFIIKTNPIILK